jgi:hypothetical protein
VYTSSSGTFKVTFGVFDEAEAKRKEVEVEVTYEYEAKYPQGGLSKPKPTRLWTCIRADSIPHGGNTSDLVWLLDAKQTWLGEKKGENDALYAVNEIIAYGDPEDGCVIGGSPPVCTVDMDVKPGETESMDCSETSFR